MELTTGMEEALNERFNWKLTNVPELEQPVLIVLDYSPSIDKPLLSIAFDSSSGPKCWLTVSKVILIDRKGPSPHEDYRKFVFGGRKFYPYSITSFPNAIFDDIRQFTRACEVLYQHADWS